MISPHVVYSSHLSVTGGVPTLILPIVPSGFDMHPYDMFSNTWPIMPNCVADSLFRKCHPVAKGSEITVNFPNVRLSLRRNKPKCASLSTNNNSIKDFSGHDPVNI